MLESEWEEGVRSIAFSVCNSGFCVNGKSVIRVTDRLETMSMLENLE